MYIEEFFHISANLHNKQDKTIITLRVFLILTLSTLSEQAGLWSTTSLTCFCVDLQTMSGVIGVGTSHGLALVFGKFKLSCQNHCSNKHF